MITLMYRHVKKKGCVKKGCVAYMLAVKHPTSNEKQMPNTVGSCHSKNSKNKK